MHVYLEIHFQIFTWNFSGTGCLKDRKGLSSFFTLHKQQAKGPRRIPQTESDRIPATVALSSINGGFTATSTTTRQGQTSKIEW